MEEKRPKEEGKKHEIKKRKQEKLHRKRTENVSFNIASEANYVYILSGQKSSFKMPKSV